MHGVMTIWTRHKVFAILKQIVSETAGGQGALQLFNTPVTLWWGVINLISDKGGGVGDESTLTVIMC